MASVTADTRGRPVNNNNNNSRAYNSTGQINRDASPTRGTGRTISLRIKSATVMLNPTDQSPLVNPIIHFGLGKLSMSLHVKTSASGDDRFAMSELIQLPYNGESILRLMLSDGTYQCGWAEVPIDRESLRTDSETSVVLKSRIDPTLKCGNVILVLKRTSTKVQPDVVIERTPLHSADSKIPSQVVPTAPETPATKPRHPMYKSTKTHVATLHNLVVDGKPCQHPYVILKQGDVSIRGPTLTADPTGTCHYDQLYTLPITNPQTEVIEMHCYDDRKLAKDPLIGTVKLPIGEKESYSRVGAPVVNNDLNNCGTADLFVNCSLRPEPTPRVTRYVPPEPVSTARSEDDDMVSSHSNAVHKENLVSKTGTSVNSLCVIIAKHFDQSANAFIKVKLGKDELRATHFSDVQGDRMIFPYHSERYMHFTAQQDRKAQRDPVVGEYQLDLSPIIAKEEESTKCTVNMCHPNTGANVGQLHIIIEPSSDNQAKAVLKSGPNLLAKSEDLPEAAQPAAFQIAVVKVVDPPNVTPGHEYKLRAEFGKDNSRYSEAVPVNSSGELAISQSYLCNYQKKRFAKISLVDVATEECCGWTYLDMDHLLANYKTVPTSSHPFSSDAGNILLKVEPVSRKLQNSRFAQNDAVHTLKSCETLEIKVLSAYDLVYESTSDVLDPYCCISHGKTKLEGKSQKNAGLNPIIMNTFTVSLEPGEPVILSLHDKAVLHKDTEIGYGCVDVDDLTGQQQLVVLMKNNNPVGSVLCTVKGSNEKTSKPKVEQDKMDEYKGMHSTDLIKFGHREYSNINWPGLIVVVHCAKRLGGAEYDEKESCEAIVAVNNGSHKIESTPRKITNLHNAPINEYFAFPKSDYRILRFDVQDKKLTGKKVIGSGNVDLGELYNKLQLVQAAQKPHVSQDIIRRVDSDDLKQNIEDLSLDKEIEMFDEFGRRAGSLIVSVSQAKTRVEKVGLCEAPRPSSGSTTINSCITDATSCRIRVMEGDGVDANSKPYITLNWFNRSVCTRVCTASDNKAFWQDDLLIPCLPAQKNCSFTLNRDARDSVIGVGTIPDLEAILNQTQPTDRWVVFNKPGGAASDTVGRVHMIIQPSPCVQSKLQCVQSANVVALDTYKSVKVSVVRLYDLHVDPLRDTNEVYTVVRHDTLSLKGGLHTTSNRSTEIMETSSMPIQPNNPIHINVIGANNRYGDFHIGQARLHLPDLGVEHSERGVRGTAPIVFQGKYTGTIDYVLTLRPNTVVEPTIEAADIANMPTSIVMPSSAIQNESAVIDGRPLFKGLDIEVVKVQDVPIKTSTVIPYVYVILGSIKLRGHTLESNNSGTCLVGDLFKLPIQSVEFIKFEVYDDQKLRRDPVLASAKLSLATLIYNEKYSEVQRLKLPLFKSDGSAGGNLFMKVRGHPTAIYTSGSVETVHSLVETGSSSLKELQSDISSHGASKIATPSPYQALRVEILNASRLTSAKANPYVIGRLGEHSLRTHTLSTAEKTPNHGATDFGDVFFYPYAGEKKMKLTVYDDRKLQFDEELGYCKMDLEPVLLPTNNGEAQYLTGYLVDKRTGELTNAEITVLVTPQTDAIPKAIALAPEQEEIDQSKPENALAPSTDLLGTCLTLTDLKVTDLPTPAPKGGVAPKLNPYIITRLGHAKIRTDKPIGGVKFDDSLEFNMKTLTTGAKQTGLEFLVMDNIKFHIDSKLGKGKLDITSLKLQDGGTFTIPLNDVKSGKPNGSKLSGEYFWSQKVMKKKACKVIHLNSNAMSPLDEHDDVEDSIPLVAKQERPQSYIITVQPATIANATKPYIEMTFDSRHLRTGKKLRFDHVFLPDSKITEIGKLPACATNTNCRLTIRDNKKMQIDPLLLKGVLDLSALKVNEKKTFYVRCSGKKTYQEIEFDVTGSNAVVDKPTVQEIKNGSPATPPTTTPTTASPGTSSLYKHKYDSFALEITSLNDLSSVHLIVKNDPYVKVAHGTDSACSDVFEGGGENVNIYTCFTMPLHPTDRECLIHVMDKETLGGDIVVGTAVIDLVKVSELPGARQPINLTILNAKKQSAGLIKGTIKLENSGDPGPLRPKIVKVTYA